ncbi:hypothetical protein JTE90_022054 [Oedothorax gibbosus]|uniref:G-protein coupled receptors family 1 profile domain-containing protein n=1 Tax=Oedothorax gibbosus TaxID=931172 RepID=A0AAV6V2U9_9ARAC|nr:hypothetical protein JTE90_022054 [Oedothorax gibbosus]
MSPPPLTPLTLLDLTLVVVLTLIILITILGNTLIIAAVATTRRLRTVTNYFVVSLAVSDLLVGLLVMPFAVVKEVTDGLWLFGQVACELWVSLDVMLCTASILNLCCISLDRYFAITQPLAYAVKRSVRLALVMIGVVWVVSAIITCPPMFGWHDRDKQNDTDCAYIADQGYVVYSALGSFYIPALIMVYVYWRIFAVARKRQAVLMQGADGAKNKENQGGSDSNSSTLGDTGENQRILKDNAQLDAAGIEENTLPLSRVRGGSTKSCGSRRRSSFSIIRSNHFFLSRQNTYNPSVTTRLYHQQKHQDNNPNWDTQDLNQPRNQPQEAEDQGPYHCQYCNPKKERPSRMTIRKKDGYERAAFQRERRVAKSLSVVVGGFIVCWLPFFTVYLIEPFCESCVFHPTLTACLVWLGWVNSAINPFIYALNNNDFKKAFLRLTIDKCRCCKKTRKGHDPQQFI